MSAGLKFILQEQELLLLPEKAIYWPAQKAIIVADVHLGKVGHFRKSGFAVPAQLAQDDLICLTRIIEQHHPEKIWYLGDLFHSEMNADWDAFAAWRNRYDHIQMELVIGNHDIIDESHYHQLSIATSEDLQVGPFLMLHHPQNSLELQQHNSYVLCGHIHPGVQLVGRGRQSVTLPCFTFGERQAILPSFGKFTGQVNLRHERTDRVFGVLKDKVIAV